MVMKTTFDLPETLVQEVKRIAKSRGTTAREIVRQALVRVVAEEDDWKPFVLRDMSVPGWDVLMANAGGRTLNELILATYDDPDRL
jgi:metal-responsive CopG/Arc/MetJ family transcriptional regulator